MRILVASALLAMATWASPALATLKDGLTFLARGSYSNAYTALKEAADAGDVVAARTLGWMCERGVETRGGLSFRARPEESASWYRKAAEAADAESAKALGMLLAVGHGVPRDPVASLQWFRRAAVDVDKVQAARAAVPQPDRDAIVAWTLAIYYALHREVGRYPRQALVDNDWGTVGIEFDAASGTAIVSRTDTLETLRLHVEAAGRRALAVAPPVPEAVKHGIKAESEVRFLIGSP